MTARPWPRLSVLALIGFYLSLDIPLLGGVLPNAIGAVFGFALLALHARRIDVKVVWTISGIFLFYIVSCVYTALRSGSSSLNTFQPSIQILYSLLSAYGVFLDISLWKRKDVNRLALWFSLLLLLGSIIEVYTPLKSLIDKGQGMHLLTREGRLESAVVNRDINLYGRARPRFFTSETSYVGTNFGMFASIWLITAPRLSVARVVQASLVLLAALLVIRSPFVILPALIASADAVFNKRKTKPMVYVSLVELLLFGVIAMAGLAVLGWAFVNFFGQRAELAGRGTDWSVIARTYGAILAGWNVAIADPLFGAGAGNFDGFREIMAQTYIDFHVPEYVIRSEMFSRSLNNGIGATLAFFGLGGAAIIIFMQVALGRALDRTAASTFLLALLFVIFSTAGNVYSPKVIWPYFIILACLVAAGNKDYVEALPKRQSQRQRGLNSNEFSAKA